MSTSRPACLLLGTFLMLGGCAGMSGGPVTAASTTFVEVDWASLPSGRVSARDSGGQNWSVTVMQTYFSASEQVCMDAMIARIGSAAPMVPAVLCRQGDSWRVATPLRSDSREASTRLPDRLIL